MDKKEQEFKRRYDHYFSEAMMDRDKNSKRDRVRADNIARVKAAREVYDEYAGVDFMTKSLDKLRKKFTKKKQEKK
jgi:hypothetical protein